MLPKVGKEKHVQSVQKRLSKAPPTYEHSSAVKLMAMSVALPLQCPGIRLPTVDCPRSSICTVSDQFATKSPQFGFLNNGFDNTTALVCLIGQPGRILMHWESYIPKGPYNLYFNSKFDNKWLICPGDTELVSKQECWPLAGGKLNSAIAAGPHGRTLSVGTSRGCNYVFMNGGDSIDLSSDGASFGTFAGELRFTVLSWSGRNLPPAPIAQFGVAVVAGAFAFGTYWTAGGAGYYALSFDELNHTSGSTGTGDHGVLVDLNTKCDHGWRIRSHGDFDPAIGGDTNLLEDARLNACSLLISNSTSEIQKSGNVLAARLRNQDPITVTAAELSRAGEKYTGLAANGCYTFKEFTEEAANFKEVCTTTTSSVFLTYELDHSDYYHFIALSTVETLRQNFYVTYASTVEFKTDVARYPKDIAPCDYAALLAARRLIASNPVWFYENPLHAAQIYRFLADAVRRGAKFLSNNSDSIASVVGAAAPQYALPAQLMAKALQALKL